MKVDESDRIYFMVGLIFVGGRAWAVLRSSVGPVVAVRGGGARGDDVTRQKKCITIFFVSSSQPSA
jgi:hypothetical protein